MSMSMSVSMIEAMAAVASGGAPAQLLHACRLEVGGFDAFGIEAIGDAFRRDPVSLDSAIIAENAMNFAAIVGDQALVADLYDGNIGRLWRAGRDAPHATEPFVAVPFDPDLRQARGDIEFLASDHPGLAAEAERCVRDAGLAILAHDPMAWRSRAFAIRAFGTPANGAALFAVYRMTADRVRASGFGHAVAVWEDGNTRIAVDTIPAPGDGRVRIVG